MAVGCYVCGFILTIVKCECRCVLLVDRASHNIVLWMCCSQTLMVSLPLQWFAILTPLTK